jgi:hypothetical protein
LGVGVFGGWGGSVKGVGCVLCGEVVGVHPAPTSTFVSNQAGQAYTDLSSAK